MTINNQHRHVDTISTKTASKWLVTAQPPIEDGRDTLSEVDEWQARGDNWQGFCLRFDSPLDPQLVREGLSRTLTHIPALGARVDTVSNPLQCELVLTNNKDKDDYNDKGNQGVILECVKGTCDDIANLPNDTHTRDEWKRAGLDAPKAGYSTPTLTDPLFRARLTVFNNSISYLAIGISHGLCDGHGFCDILQIWSHFCVSDNTSELPESLKTPRTFGKRATMSQRPATTDAELKSRMQDEVGTSYFPFSAWTFFVHVLPRAIWCMARQQVVEVRIQEQRLQQLKDKLLSSGNGLPEGVEWLSRFEVLMAALLCAQREAGHFLSSPTHRLHVACDLRGRVERFPADYFGNAAFDFHKDIELPPLPSSSSLSLAVSEDMIKTAAVELHNMIRAGLADPEDICKTKDWYEAARHLGYKNTYNVWEPVMMDIVRGTGSFINNWGPRFLEVSMGAPQKATSMAVYFGVIQNAIMQVPRHRESGDSTIYLAMPFACADKFVALCEEKKELLPFKIVQ